MEVYGIKKICSDTQMRQVLDTVKASAVREWIQQLIRKVKKSNFFTSYRYWKDLVVVSIDEGRTFFFSEGAL